jgi:transposase
MYYWDSAKGPCERVALRVMAVRSVAGGERKSDVAQRFGITRQTLDAWLERHRSGGMEALAARPRGRSKTNGTDRDHEHHSTDGNHALGVQGTEV